MNNLARMAFCLALAVAAVSAGAQIRATLLRAALIISVS